MQIRVYTLGNEQDAESGEQNVIVEGTTSPDGLLVQAVVVDGPTANLLNQILASAGPETLRKRLAEEQLVWACEPCGERQVIDGVLRARVRDAASIRSLCEQLRARMFAPERGQPILVGFPPDQSGGYG
jgi:hypothetical protein